MYCVCCTQKTAYEMRISVWSSDGCSSCLAARSCSASWTRRAERMAATLMPASGRRGSRGAKPRYRPLSEINVTPFVDVMLVLLIVFMVTAPLLTVGVPVDLPKTRAQSIADPEIGRAHV